MRRIALGAIFLLGIYTMPAFASVKDDVKKGNLLYNDKHYSEAAKMYE